MKWIAYDHRVFGSPKKRGYRSDDGRFSIAPAFSMTQRRRKTKQVVYRLFDNKRLIGKPFASSLLAKAFAEAYALLETPRERAEFIRDGGAWCWDWQRARTSRLNDERWAREAAEREAASSA